MNRTETFLADSGLFTQVEPRWLADDQGYATWVNRSRGVVIRVDYTITTGQIRYDARLFIDHGGETFYSSGHYSVVELHNWWFPVMRSDKAWSAYQALPEGDKDVTLVIDYAELPHQLTEAEWLAEYEPQPTIEAVEVDHDTGLTLASLDLFLGLVEDASNWSGMPLVTVSASQKGNLTDLKRKGLIQTMDDEDGCVFALFTEAGVALAAQHGHDLNWIRASYDPKA